MMSASTYSFDISALGFFASNCRSTRSLIHFSNERCARDGDALEARVQDVQTACCLQSSKYCPGRDSRTPNAPSVHFHNTLSRIKEPFESKESF